MRFEARELLGKWGAWDTITESWVMLPNGTKEAAEDAAGEFEAFFEKNPESQIIKTR